MVVAMTEVLPLAGRAHAAMLGLLLDVPLEAPFRVAAHLAAAVAMIVFARRRLGPALGDGLGALVRPRSATEPRGAREAFGWALSTAIGVPGAIVFSRLGAGIADAPLAMGAGLLTTGVMLMSTSAAGRAGDDALTPRRAVIVGLCQALAAFAGGSAMGAALASLLWTGMRARRAAETASALSFPQEIVFALTALADPSTTHRIAERPGVFGASLAAALIVALLAIARLVRVAERRLVTLGAYAAVLGAGLVAYGWALH